MRVPMARANSLPHYKMRRSLRRLLACRFLSHPTRRTSSRHLRRSPRLERAEEAKMISVSEDGKRRRDGSGAMYSQLRQSLIQLQEAADRIFDAISVRITEEREKLGNISARIENAKGKIDAMSHSNHPLTIHSPSTYLSKSTGEVDYHPLFSYMDGSDSAGFPVGKLLVNGGLDREFGVDGTLELFRFFSETSFESLPKEVSDGASHLKGLTYSAHLLVPPKIPNNSFLAKDHSASESKCKPESQSLPPPPPSLLMQNSQGLLPPRPERFSFRPAVKQLQSLMLSDTQPDLATVSNSDSSEGVHFPSKTSKDHSHEAGSSMLLAGRGTIHQPTDPSSMSGLGSTDSDEWQCSSSAR